MYYPHYLTSIRYTFTLQCPNLSNQLTLSLLHDATIHGDIHYYDVCKVAGGKITIAYNNYGGALFQVDPKTESITEYSVRPVKELYLQISLDWEIVNPFIDHYSLTPTWINCQWDWGRLDEKTGTWTGATGKVRNLDFLFLSKPIDPRSREMRQTGQCLTLPAPMAGALLHCVLLLSCGTPYTGGHDIPRRELSSGTSPTCFTLRPGCGHS